MGRTLRIGVVKFVSGIVLGIVAGWAWMTIYNLENGYPLMDLGGWWWRTFHAFSVIGGISGSVIGILWAITTSGRERKPAAPIRDRTTNDP